MANERMTMSSDGYAKLRQREAVKFHYYNDTPRNGNCTRGVGTLGHLGHVLPRNSVAPYWLPMSTARYMTASSMPKD